MKVNKERFIIIIIIIIIIMIIIITIIIIITVVVIIIIIMVLTRNYRIRTKFVHIKFVGQNLRVQQSQYL
jgi:hypothetical protein